MVIAEFMQLYRKGSLGPEKHACEAKKSMESQDKQMNTSKKY